MSIFGFKILSRLIQSTIGDLDRIPKSNEILTMPVEAQKSFQNFWVNFDCTFIDISTSWRLRKDFTQNPGLSRRRISSPRSYTNAYDWRFVKGCRAACISLMNVTEYAAAEIVHFHLLFLYIFA